MNYNYYLSNSTERICFEKNLEISELGKLFNSKLSKLLQYDVVASELIINQEWITIIVKERGQKGGHFGTVLRCIENNVSSIRNATCQAVWNALCDSLTEMNYAPLDVHSSMKRDTYKKLNVTIYDFEKRSRIGFFMQYSKELQAYLRNRYPLVKMYIRFYDDDEFYYYMIFESPTEQSLAEDQYGISNIIQSVHEFCSRYDTYHVFDSIVPMPYITTKVELESQGKMMGIIRDNSDFERVWD